MTMLPPLVKQVPITSRSATDAPAAPSAAPSSEAIATALDTYAPSDVITAAAVDYTPGNSAHIGSSPAWKKRQAELLGLAQPSTSSQESISIKLQPPSNSPRSFSPRASLTSSASTLSPPPTGMLLPRPKSAPDAPANSGTLKGSAPPQERNSISRPRAPEPSHTSPAVTVAQLAANCYLHPSTANTAADVDLKALPHLPRSSMPAKLLAGADVRNGLRSKLQHNAARTAPDTDVLLEAWVNNVLATSYVPGTVPHGPTPPATGALTAAAQPPPGMTGLAKFGLAPQELLRAGVSGAAARRLYKGLYVYSMGLFDMLQDTLRSSPFRTEVLNNAWHAFLAISETALHTSFRSEFLTLLASNEMAMGELEAAREQLMVAQAGNTELAHSVQWLAEAHAEEQQLRTALRDELGLTKAELGLEKTAHQQAVDHFTDAVQSRSQMQLQLQDVSAQLQALQQQHAQLQQQHASALQELGANRVCQLQVTELMEDMGRSMAGGHVFHRLDMAGGKKQEQQGQEHKVQQQQQQQQQQVPCAMEASFMDSAGGGAVNSDAALLQLAQLLQQQVDTMVVEYGDARVKCDEAKVAMYHMSDELRAVKLQAHDLEQELTHAQKALSNAGDMSAAIDEELAWTKEQLQISIGQLEARDALLELRNAELSEAMVQLAELQGTCDAKCKEIFDLERARRASEEQHQILQGKFDQAVQRGRELYSILRMHSRTLALAMRSTWDLQAARRVLLRQLDSRSAALGAQQEELREVIGRLADTTGRLELREAQARALQTRCDDVEAAHQRMSHGLSEMKAQSAQQAADIKAKDTEIRALQAQQQKLEATRAGIEKAAAKAARDAEAHLTALQLEWARERARLQDSAERALQEVGQLRETNKNISNQLRARDRQMNELRGKMLEQQAAAQADQAKLLSQMRALDNDLKLARLDSDKSRAQLELAVADIERSRMERDAATRSLGRSEYEAKRMAYELGQRDVILKELRDQVAALVEQVQQLQQHQQRLVSAPLAALLPAGVTAPRTPRSEHSSAAPSPLPLTTPITHTSSSTSSAAAPAPSSPRQAVPLSPRALTGIEGEVEGATPAEGGHMSVPVEVAQRLADAAVSEAAEAATQLRLIDERVEVLQKEANAVMARVARELSALLAKKDRKGGKAGGPSSAEVWDNATEHAVRQANDSLRMAREQQMTVLHSRSQLLQRQMDAMLRSDRIGAGLRKLVHSNCQVHEEQVRKGVAAGVAAVAACITQQLLANEEKFTHLEARVSELLAASVKHEESRDAMQQQMEEMQRASEPLYEKLVLLDAQVAKMTWELDTANSRINDLLVDVGKLRADKDELEHRISTDESAEVIAELRDRVARMQQELNESHKSVADSLRRLHMQQEQQRASLETKFDQERQRLRREITELREALSINSMGAVSSSQIGALSTGFGSTTNVGRTSPALSGTAGINMDTPATSTNTTPRYGGAPTWEAQAAAAAGGGGEVVVDDGESEGAGSPLSTYRSVGDGSKVLAPQGSRPGTAGSKTAVPSRLVRNSISRGKPAD